MDPGGSGALEALAAALDTLQQADPSAYGDPESIQQLHRELARLEAFVTAAAAAFDAAGAWVPDGARNAASWLTTKCRLSKREARRRIRLGRQLRSLPLASEAFAAGELTAAHVEALGGCLGGNKDEAMRRDEGLLVDQARRLRVDDFARALSYWRQLADPDGAERDADFQRAERAVSLDQSIDGMYFGRLTLDPVSGAIVSGEIKRLEQELFENDWAEAKLELDRDPTIEELRRTSDQRRADALVEMATRSRTAPPDGRRPAPLFSVLVDYDTLHGRILELAQGAALTPGSLVPWLDRAYIERAVFGPAGRVEIGATTRLFTGATRRGVELRDRRCTHPHCDRSAEDCQVDHILPYTDGGLTTQENGRLLCGFHNRLRNQRPPPAAS